MPLPIRELPIVENWTCGQCALCCRGTIVNLSDYDLKRFREQGWEQHPDYRGKRLLVRTSWFPRRYRLAKRPDGQCVFLTDDGLCRIHCDLGEAAKPVVCRTFPFQLVTLDNTAYVTLRRYCPTAVQDLGEPVREQLGYVAALAAEGKLAERPTPPPRISADRSTSWRRVLQVGDAVDRLLRDDRYPPVRRVVHMLRFAGLLEPCRISRVDEGDFASLVEMLESAVNEDEQVAMAFRTRRAPRSSATMVFRQIGLEYSRLHPKFVIRETWLERMRLVRAAIGFAWGKGKLPFLHECFPPGTFDTLNRPLGPLPNDVAQPIYRFFETMAVSKQYLLLCRQGWSVAESLRFLTASYAVALWLLRLSSGEQVPTRENAIDAVAAIDRGQGFALFTSARHRRRLNLLARNGELERLVIWFAR